MSEFMEPEPTHKEPSAVTGSVNTGTGGEMKVTATENGVSIAAPGAASETENDPLRGDPSTVTQAFVGLPMGQLICGPIIEVAKGQAELCKVYMEYVMALAYQKDKDGNLTKDTNIVSFALERPVTKEDGTVDKKKFTVNAPLISLVPVPAFLMEEATVRFTMEVRETKTSAQSTDANVGFKTGFSFWKFKTEITGSVTHHSESSSTASTNATYEVYARARQQPPAEGMAKLTSLFASVIDPIPATVTPPAP